VHASSVAAADDGSNADHRPVALGHPARTQARLLGIHVTVAVAWQRASAGDWAAYAAEVSRRTRKEEPS
jgi:hypothetical protein